MQIDWRAIEREVPGLSVRSVRFLGEGWVSRAYLVNGDVVFRCPKRAAQWEELDREQRFLAWAADRLPLRVPRYVHAVPYSAGAPHGFGIYPYLRGDPFDPAALSTEARTAAAQHIAGFLRALHDLEPDPAIDALLSRGDEREDARQLLDGARRIIVPALERSAAAALEERFNAYLGTAANFAFRPTVVHADFSREHILMENGRVSAVLDFGDVVRSDPDYDFLYLFIHFGRPFTDQVARRYEHPDVARLHAKLEYFALTEPLDTILDGAGYALAGQRAEAWQRLRRLLRQPAPGVES